MLSTEKLSAFQFKIAFDTPDLHNPVFAVIFDTNELSKTNKKKNTSFYWTALGYREIENLLENTSVTLPPPTPNLTGNWN